MKCEIPYFILFDHFLQLSSFPLLQSSFSAPSFTSTLPLSLSPTLFLSSSLPPTCFYITLFSMRSTLPYMSQLIGPAAQLKFTIATMIQSPSNGFYFHPTSYSGTPISPQPIVQWVNLLISDKVWLSYLASAVSQSSSQQWVAEIHVRRDVFQIWQKLKNIYFLFFLWFICDSDILILWVHFV